ATPGGSEGERVRGRRCGHRLSGTSFSGAAARQAGADMQEATGITMKQSPIQFIDTTLRDGNQSLWAATGLRTGMMLPIAPVMDEVGYHSLDFSTSTHMAVTVRFHKEDPWERLRLMKERLKRTSLTFLSTGMRFISWETAHPEVMALSYKLLVNNGIERFMVMDPMNT